MIARNEITLKKKASYFLKICKQLILANTLSKLMFPGIVSAKILK